MSDWIHGTARSVTTGEQSGGGPGIGAAAVHAGEVALIQPGGVSFLAVSSRFPTTFQSTLARKASMYLGRSDGL